MREEERRLRNKSTSYPDTLDYAVWGMQAYLPPLFPHANRRIKPVQSKTGSLAISAHSASFAELGRAGLAGRDSFCSICGFALDTARFGCQNPYPRAADGPGESGRTKLRKWNTYRYQIKCN